jgi:nucleotide-binding universal stress UspA family protein
LPEVGIVKKVVARSCHGASNELPLASNWDGAIAREGRQHIGMPQVVRTKGTSQNVAKLLLAQTASRQYGYLVMGAYSRPRLIEALFGGTTRMLLKESRVPLLIAH